MRSKQASLIPGPKPNYPMPLDTAGRGQYLAMLRFRIAFEETAVTRTGVMQGSAYFADREGLGVGWCMEVWNANVMLLCRSI